MFPYRRLPSHITGLYIFTVVNFFALINSTIVHGRIYVRNDHLQEVDVIDDVPAQFGKKKPWNLNGSLICANPINACSDLSKPPNFSNHWIVLIRRYDCNFDVKVRHAQQAGYDAAIIHNVNSDRLEEMGSTSAGDITIPSVFIGQTDGTSLKEYYTYEKNYTLFMYSESDGTPASILDYLIAFACIMGFIFLITVTTLIVRYIRDLQQRRRHQLSPQHLKKLPVKKFEKGDNQYETCAICLEDYMDGDKMRILPCSHAYHTKCIDPWLTKSRRTCPVCKRRVFTEGEVSDSEDDSDDDENTPLLNAGNQPTTSGNTFNVPQTHRSIENATNHPNSAERTILIVATNITSVLPPPSTGMSINLEDGDIIHTNSSDRSQIDEGPISVGISASMDSDIVRRQGDSPIQIGTDAASASIDVTNGSSRISTNDKEHVLVV